MESQTNKDVKKVAKGAGTAVTGRFLGRIFIFLTQVAIARLFGAEIFGLYALGMATVRFSELFSRLGLDKGGMMFVAIYRDESPSKLKGVVYSATGFSFLCGSVLGILLYLFSGLISVYIFKEPQLQETIKLFAFCVPFFSSVTVVASLLQGFYSIKYAVYSRDIIQPLVNLILIIIFYYFGFALSGAIFAFTLSNIFAFAAGIWYIHKAFGYLKIKYIKSQYEFKKLFSYSTPFLFAGLLYYLFAWIDTLMLGFLGTAKDVGIYRAAIQAPLILYLFRFALGNVVSPLFATLYKNKEIRRFENIAKTTTRWMFYVILPLSIMLIFSAKELMLIFGGEYVEGYPVLIVYTFSMIASCMAGGFEDILNMTGKQYIELLISFIIICSHIIINSFLIPMFGVIGAVITVSISTYSLLFARVLALHYYLKITPFSINLLLLFIPGIITSFLLIAINQLQDYIGIFGIVAVRVIVVILIFGIYFKFNKNPQDQLMIDLIRKKMGM